MSSTKRVFIASDHAGIVLKNALQESLKKILPEWEWNDLGPFDATQKVDYPDYAEILGKKLIAEKGNPLGILICGSGIGMCIAANKLSGIRAALVENPIAAQLSREHNNANVLCLGSRFIAPEYGTEIVKVWLTTPFSNDPRHIHRVDKICSLEKKS